MLRRVLCKSSFFVSAGAFFLLLTGTAVLPAQPAQTSEQRLLPVPEQAYQEALEQPKNLAETAMATTLLQQDQDQWQAPADNSLLTSDPAAEQSFASGQHRLLLDLHDFHSINTLGLHSHGLSGRITLKSANAPLPPTSPRWRSLTEAALEPDQYNKIEFPLAEARFILVELEVGDAGTLDQLYLAGNQPISHFALRIPPAEEWSEISDDTPLTELDFAKISSGGRITHVSSGQPELAWHMIDDAADTAFEFSPQQDGSAFFIAALHDNYPLETVSLQSSPFDGTVSVYAFDTFPQELSPTADTDETIVLTDRFFAAHTASATVHVDQPAERIQLSLNQTSARYLLVHIQATPSEASPLVINQFLVTSHVPAHYARFHPSIPLLVPTAPATPNAPAGADVPMDPPRLPPTPAPASL